jgi:hypothetical protein
MRTLKIPTKVFNPHLGYDIEPNWMTEIKSHIGAVCDFIFIIFVVASLSIIFSMEIK